MYWLAFPLVALLLSPVWLNGWKGQGIDGTAAYEQESALQADSEDTSGVFSKREGTTGIPPH